jgi:hypothetical protein
VDVPIFIVFHVLVQADLEPGFGVDKNDTMVMYAIVDFDIHVGRTVQFPCWIVWKRDQEWKTFASSWGPWRTFDVGNQGPIDPVNLILHHITFPFEAAWNVIEHEGQLVPIPNFTVPYIV